MTSEEEEFNNPVDWMTYSVDSQFLSLAIPAQVAMVWEMAMYWLNNEDFFTKAGLAVVLGECQICPAAEINKEPLIWCPVTWGWPASDLVAG